MLRMAADGVLDYPLSCFETDSVGTAKCGSERETCRWAAEHAQHERREACALTVTGMAPASSPSSSSAGPELSAAVSRSAWDYLTVAFLDGAAPPWASEQFDSLFC